MRGVWHNDPVLHLLPGTRTVETPVPLVYRDRRGVLHTVPAGERSDGLTSPAWTWSLIGAPLTPAYRRPALLHDHYCRTRAVTSRMAHRLLYEALREARPGRWWALRCVVFHVVVRALGPRW